MMAKEEENALNEEEFVFPFDFHIKTKESMGQNE